MASAEFILTAEEFARLPSDDRPRELERGRVLTKNPPYPYHGYVCANISGILAEFVRPRHLGRVLTNDAGVVTERQPDTVRGADVCFYTFARLPLDALLKDAYLSVVPELIFEVRSPSDRWPQILKKVTEYLLAGVLVVCVVDSGSETVIVYHQDDSPRVLSKDDMLTLPQVLPGFQVRVGQMFE